MTAVAIDAGTAAVLLVTSAAWGRLGWRDGSSSLRVVACLVRIALTLMAIHYSLSVLAAVAGLSNGGS